MKKSMAVEIGAVFGSGFKPTFKTAQQYSSKLGQSLLTTNKKLAASKAVIKYRQQLAMLKQKQQAAGGSSKRLAAGIAVLEGRYRRAKTAAKSYGIQIGRVAQQQRRLSMQSKLQGMRMRGRQQLGQAWGGLKSKALGAGIVLGTVGLPVKIAADFEKAMSKVKAISNASTAEITLLTNEARRLGRSTAFTASQAAEGQAFLAQAGFKTQEIVKAMPGLLDLAASADMELGETAGIAAAMLRGFNLDAKQSTRVADVLAKATSSSNTNLTQLGEAMKYVAPAAANLGVSLEETAAMIGILGNAGIQGTMAGTTMRKILSSLAAPTSEGAQALQDMGIEITDMDGNMRPLSTIMQEFAKATTEMGNAQKAAAVKAIFGERAMSGMLKFLSKGGVTKIRELRQELDKADGAAAKMAKERLNNLSGQLKILGSVMSDLGISIGNVLLPPLTLITRGLAAVLGPIGRLAVANPIVTKTIVSLGAALIGVKVVLPLVALGVKALGAAIMANPIGLIIGGIAIGASLIIQYWEPISGFFGSLWDGISEAFQTGWQWIKKIFSFSPLGMIINNWKPIMNFFGNLWNFIIGGAKRAIGYIISKFNVVGRIWKGIKSFFGFDSDEEKSDVKNVRADKAIKAAQATSPAGALQRSRNDKSTVNNNQTITINTQPDQNPEEIAEMVMQKQKERDNDRRQGGLYDYEPSYA
ncbi:MAG: phage tail tape measure protein [Lentisphaerae bacterium]|nr:phage tail tape measure protein [Lentisphaerota bacterium]